MRNKTTQLGFLTPRSIAAIVILLGILLIPLWWLKGKSDRAAEALAKEKAIAQGSVNASPPLPEVLAVNKPDAFGLTWGMQADDKLQPDAIRMGCHGQPRDTISQPHAESCNPYAGDSSCRLVLPVLCFQQTSLNEGMPAGNLASTQPVAGFVLGSLAGANARCEKELGAGWRMAEHHDGGGWSLTAKRASPLDTGMRHWVHINNQPGNCWDNKEKP